MLELNDVTALAARAAKLAAEYIQENLHIEGPEVTGDQKTAFVAGMIALSAYLTAYLRIQVLPEHVEHVDALVAHMAKNIAENVAARAAVPSPSQSQPQSQGGTNG